MAKIFNDIIVGFWGLIIALLSKVKLIFVNEFGKPNFFGFILLAFIVVMIIETGFNILVGGGENDNQ